ncbi:MAG: 23S rRNA (adenine(2503)-C(2))-methyltransferase RlmN, partial [Candidatus Omnitrophica bacterium]|nr:23S rRNA (adenine(2503)-C(2))-methyltransferase RlmN [Candidatus Omnitrophota bacterium]
MRPSSSMKLIGMLPEEIENAFRGIQLQKFRAEQVLQWIYQKNVLSFDQMTNISASDREKLKEEFEIGLPEIAEKHASREDGSVKLLLRMSDGQYAETVLIKRGARRTVCVSSQVGCKFKCVFCASGQAGFGRNLTADEIVAQVLRATEMNNGERISHIVFMGMGEPMDNLPAVLKTIKILNHTKCFGIGARRITVSTSGIVSKFETLEKEGLQVELSVSLHGADDKVRGKLMPVNRKWPVQELIKACHEYTIRTNRQI